MNDLIVRPVGRGGDHLLRHHLARLEGKRAIDGFGAWRTRLWQASTRWQWFSYLLLLGKIPSLPWPAIHFTDDDGRGRKLLHRCLDGSYDVRFEDFLAFLLHRFGHASYQRLPERVTPRHMEHWDTTFDLEVALDLEADFLGDYYAEIVSSGTRKATGYFPTPMSVVNMMTTMTLDGAKLTESVLDPAVGSGRTLLAASNKCLFLAGQDINPTCVRMCLVNGHLFAPSIVVTPPAAIRSERRFQLNRELRLALPRITHDIKGPSQTESLPAHGGA